MPQAPRHLALTGATGFVGTRLRHLSEQPLRYLSRQPSTDANSVHGSLDDTSALQKLCDGARAVVHLAAAVHNNVRGDDEVWRINVEGTARLVAATPKDATFVFVSSAAVYGEGSGFRRETSPRKPDTVYGRSKAAAEALVRGSGLRHVILQPVSVIGPGAPGNLEKLQRLIRAGIMPSIAGGTNRKNLVHVDVVARACLLAASASQSGTYLLADPDALAMSQVAEALAGEARVLPLRVPTAAASLAESAFRVARRHWPRLPALDRTLRVYSSDALFDGSLAQRELGLSYTPSARSAIEHFSRPLDAPSPPPR